MTKSRIVAVPIIVFAVLLSLASPARADDAVLFARLTGSEAVPGPGDPNGFGFGAVHIDDDTNRVCAFVWVRGISPATGAHIHFGAAGETGGHAVDLNPPTQGWSFTCTTASETVVDELSTNPEGFYLNIHNEEFHDGALRGQLRSV